MSEYCNTTSYYLPYSYFDFKDELKPSSLLDLAQEAATASADELGFGYADLKPKGYGFIIVNSYCEFRRPVMLGERITMQTWPLPPRRVFFERHYRALVGDEEVAAVASRWCLVDLQNFSLLLPEAMGPLPARNVTVLLAHATDAPSALASSLAPPMTSPGFWHMIVSSLVM